MKRSALAAREPPAAKFGRLAVLGGSARLALGVIGVALALVPRTPVAVAIRVFARAADWLVVTRIAPHKT